MKLRMSSVVVVALASGLLLVSSHFQRVHADDQHERACSNKTLNGSYGTHRTGTTSTGPLAAESAFSFSTATEPFLGARASAGTESSLLM